jgi:transcriptional regulator with XRE-family HTH domain
MSVNSFEKKVLSRPGASERVAQIEEELRLAAGLTALREDAGLSQREIAKLIGVSQPRVVAIEHAHNVTIDVLEQYVTALGGVLEVNVVKGKNKVSLLGSSKKRAVKSSNKVRRTAKSA